MNLETNIPPILFGSFQISNDETLYNIVLKRQTAA